MVAAVELGLSDGYVCWWALRILILVNEKVIKNTLSTSGIISVILMRELQQTEKLKRD